MLNIGNDSAPFNRLRELLVNLKYLQSLEKDSLVDIGTFNFVTPFSITPLAGEINRNNLRIDLDNSYCKVICFPKGIENVDDLDQYNNKTYLPIFHADLENDFRFLDQVASSYVKLIIRNMNSTDQAFMSNLSVNALASMVGELMDNIKQHSKAKNAYIFGQYYPKDNSLEFCIYDDGEGIYSSLLKAGRPVKDNLDALKQVIESHLSAKDVEGEEKRGTGIKNTRKLINNDIVRGDFVIASGNAGYIESNSVEELKQYYGLTTAQIYGTLVVCRLSKPLSKINMYDYVTN